jgi:hypothetical protein
LGICVIRVSSASDMGWCMLTIIPSIRPTESAHRGQKRG